MPDLSPCQHCGSKFLGTQEGERRTDGAAGRPAMVICADCDARTLGYSLADAIATWNRRVGPKQ